MKCTGCRIPVQYFITKGSGETDYGSKLIPFEGGSYDKALLDAKISNFNIVTYSSIIPKNCHKINRKDAIYRLKSGCVLECILCVVHGTRGQCLLAGILITKIYSEKGQEILSFVIEYGDNQTSKSKALTILFHQLQGMVENRGFGTISFHHLRLKKVCKSSSGYFIYPEDFVYQTMTISKNYGTALVSVCFSLFTSLDP